MCKFIKNTKSKAEIKISPIRPSIRFFITTWTLAHRESPCPFNQTISIRIPFNNRILGIFFNGYVINLVRRKLVMLPFKGPLGDIINSCIYHSENGHIIYISSEGWDVHGFISIKHKKISDKSMISVYNLIATKMTFILEPVYQVSEVELGIYQHPMNVIIKTQTLQSSPFLIELYFNYFNKKDIK
jgi:hypothetical protein